MNWLQVLAADFTAIQILLVVVAVFVAALLQASVGFGFALLALPIVLRAGMPLNEAVAFLIPVNLWQQTSNLIRVREHVDWRPIRPLIGTAVVFLAIGVFIQRSILQLDRGLVRQIIGGLILAVLLIQWLWRPEPRPRLHAAWAYLAGMFAGLMSGIASTSGPPVVLWIMAHDWSNRRSRGSMWAVFLCLAPFLFALLLLTYGGKAVLLPMLRGALLIPVVHFAACEGVRLGNRLPRSHLRLAATLLLFLTALAAILKI